MTSDAFDAAVGEGMPAASVPFAAVPGGGGVLKEIDPADTVGADGVALGVLLHPETGVPTLTFLFYNGETQASPLIVLSGKHAGLARLVADAMATRDEAAMRMLAEKVDRAVPDAPHATCTGCGTRIFGAMAQRGVCLTCKPAEPS